MAGMRREERHSAPRDKQEVQEPVVIGRKWSMAMWETSSGNRGVAPEGEGAAVEAVDRGENVFGRIGDFTEYFPAEQYRRGQREAIEEIEYAFEQGYKFVILEFNKGLYEW